MKKDIEITLKKDGSNDIIVKCPQKVKLSVMGALFAIRFGLPPADVTPVQVKDGNYSPQKIYKNRHYPLFKEIQM